MQSSVFLLTGPEEGERANYIKTLIKQKSDELKETPEIYRYYGFEADMLDIITLLNSGSLFCSYKFVILYNVDVIKKAADINLLTEYCQNPSQQSTLILVTNQINITHKKLESAIPQTNRKIFWELNDNQKKGWIMSFFNARNVKLEPAAVDFFIELVENNTRDLKKECNKLVNFFPVGYTVSYADIEHYIYHSKQETIFTLFDKIAARNLALSLEILEKMILSGEDKPVSIISGLLWQFRKVLMFKVLNERKYSQEDAFKTISVPSKKSQRIYKDAHKNYSRAEISAIIVLVNEYDVKFRSFKQDMHDLLLQMLLYHIVINGGITRQAGKEKFY